MKFTCEKALLAQALNLSGRVVNSRSSIEALEGIRITAGMGLSLTGYNLETGITVNLGADVAQPGSCVMPARLFTDIVRKLPDDQVTVDVDEKYRTKITCGIAAFTITCMGAEDYPALPEVDDEVGVQVLASAMKSLIGGTTFSASENFARPIHTGVLFELDGETITAVAVDGYRMAVRREAIQTPGRAPFHFVVPVSALREVEKMLDDGEEVLTFNLDKKHITFRIGDATLVCRLLDGEFLDWRKVLPTDCPIKLVGSVSRLSTAIDRMSLVVSEKVKTPVRCVFGKNEVDFRTASTVGSAHDCCDLAGDGMELEIGFNCRYLLEALRAVPDEEVTLELTNGLSPIVLTPCDGSRSYAYMVLPVRLKAEA